VKGGFRHRIIRRCGASLPPHSLGWNLRRKAKAQIFTQAQTQIFVQMPVQILAQATPQATAQAAPQAVSQVNMQAIMQIYDARTNRSFPPF
jgi:hypothetical protein